MKKFQFAGSTLKLVLITALVLLFLVPISLIKSLIYDRQNYQRTAIISITEPLGGTAELQGIVVAVPYKIHREVFDANGKSHFETETSYVVFAPDTYDLNFSVEPYYLTRGIFKVPVFNGSVSLKSDFSNFDFSYFKIEDKDIMLNDAVLILGLSNTKNLTAQPKLLLNGKELSVSPVKYEGVAPFTKSVCYNLNGTDFSKGLALSGELEFQGGEKIRIRPIAQDNVFRMTSPWTSPSFSGGWLPKEREITDKGFNALWNIAGLSTVYPKSWLCKDELKGDAVDVSFIVPVDTYKKTERSVKYALLFLVIPFIALLISEIFSKVKIHPVQYCLIGFADVIFYLLLLSVSEHIPFDLTYFICALAVCLATLFYASAIFKKIKWGALLSGVQFVSYVFLYGTLQAEDYALLIGSIGLFVVVVLLMFITRKIDWYGLGQNTQNPQNPSNT